MLTSAWVMAERPGRERANWMSLFPALVVKASPMYCESGFGEELGQLLNLLFGKHPVSRGSPIDCTDLAVGLDCAHHIGDR